MNPLDTLVDRNHLPKWLVAHGLTGTGLEIGTYKGEFADQILISWPGVLYTVDPYIQMEDEEYRDGCVHKVCLAGVMTEATHRLSAHGLRCVMFRNRSIDAVPLFNDESLGFVYIDGNHDFEHVTEDITNWWTKVAPGGLFGGHDFYTRNDEAQRADVANAVLDFAERIGVRPRVTPCSSWWFIKPRVD